VKQSNKRPLLIRQAEPEALDFDPSRPEIRSAFYSRRRGSERGQEYHLVLSKMQDSAPARPRFASKGKNKPGKFWRDHLTHHIEERGGRRPVACPVALGLRRRAKTRDYNESTEWREGAIDDILTADGRWDYRTGRRMLTSTTSTWKETFRAHDCAACRQARGQSFDAVKLRPGC